MVFTAPVFLFFFLPLVLLMHGLARGHWRNTALLVTSLFFYAWGEGVYVLLMLLSVSVNHLIGEALNRVPKKKKGLLAAGVGANLLVLLWCKYANFIADALAPIMQMVGVEVSLQPVHLPIGISFFTFQAISYLVDVSRGECQAQRRWSDTALYISLFPQLIAGPIVRYADVAEQIASRLVTLELFASGVMRFLLGLGKKVIIANTLGEVADQLFVIGGADLNASAAWLAVLCYTLQIYFDFSGYSDMAIGLGRMFGFRFRENFNLPYSAVSIQDFWRRWHMSLSTWFRDYLYIPLGGNRKGVFREYAHLWIVFLLCGLWHGASWNFLIWGALHGAYLTVERYVSSKSELVVPRVIRHVYVWLLVMIGWVFFRAEDLPSAWAMLASMADLSEFSLFELGPYLNAHTGFVLLLGCLFSLVRPLDADAIMQSDKFQLKSFGLVLSAILIGGLCLTYIAAQTYDPFIYFRF